MMRNPLSSLLRCALLAVLCASIAACVPRVSPQAVPEPSTPADFPDGYYRQAELFGSRLYRVNPKLSLVVLEVRRGGPLARMGHDHVVASHDVKGYVLPDEGRADLYVPFAGLSVDEAELRTEAGMESQPPQDAVDGTRRNMLEKVLEVERFPFAFIRIDRKNPGDTVLAVTITLHGTSRNYDVPVQIDAQPHSFAVSGRMTIRQSDFGITPFSVLGGALQVQDRLDLRFRVVAQRN
jgi:hypothetical protein